MLDSGWQTIQYCTAADRECLKETSWLMICGLMWKPRPSTFSYSRCSCAILTDCAAACWLEGEQKCCALAVTPEMSMIITTARLASLFIGNEDSAELARLQPGAGEWETAGSLRLCSGLAIGIGLFLFPHKRSLDGAPLLLRFQSFRRRVSHVAGLRWIFLRASEKLQIPSA